MKKVHKRIGMLLFTSLFAFSISLSPVLASTAPTPPPAPENTVEAPESPDAPTNTEEAPESPDSPTSAEEADATTEEPTTTPESTGEETVEPSPSPTPEADELDVEVDATVDVDGSKTAEETAATTDTQENMVGLNEEEEQSNGGKVGDTDIVTEDANTSGTIVNTGNSNVVEDASQGGETSGGESVSIINDGNGSDSSNSGNVVDTNSSVVIQDNDANVINTLDQNSETGGNESSGNVGNTSIETGDANTSGTIINTLNTNIDGVAVLQFDVADDHVGDFVLDFSSGCIYNCATGSAQVVNAGNGSDSTNNGTVETYQLDAVFQNNELNAANYMTLSADSGWNLANNNTGGDSEIVTGDANVSANALTFANNNLAGNVIYSTVNIYGDLAGDIIFPEEMLTGGTTLANTNNGSGSANTASADLTNEQLVQQANIANIENVLLMEATTGQNDTSRNTGGNSTIETGDADVKAQVTNIVNNNILSGDWWLVIVNEAGNWIGKIIGAPEGATIAGSEGTEFSTDQSGAINVTNNGNGSSSESQGSVEATNQQVVEQTNTANVRNVLDLSANTGHNSASRNTGGDSSIKTGDANIIANLVNFVNNNIVGSGRLYVTVVNVFGSWIGDFVGPGQEQEPDEVPEQVADNKASSEEDGETRAIGGVPATHGENGVKSSGSSNETGEAEEPVVTPADEPFLPRIASTVIRSTGLGEVLGTEDEPQEIEEEAGTEEPVVAQETTTDKVRVNLAWLLLLAPAMAGATVVRRLTVIGSKDV